MELNVSQSGNSLATRIPSKLAKQLRVQKGSKIKVLIGKTGNVELQALPESKPHKTFAELFVSLESMRNQFIDQGYTETAVEQMRREARY